MMSSAVPREVGAIGGASDAGGGVLFGVEDALDGGRIGMECRRLD
jgi:hypothetical protein